MSAEQPGAFRQWLRRQAFTPGTLGWLVNPFYFARRGLLGGLQELAPALQGSVLDVGCGRKPYRSLIPATNYLGLEIDSPHARAHTHADAFYDGRSFPFPDATFDGVLCSQVFEHVFTPVEFLAEIHRVLRPGGCLLLTVPFVWDEHEQPHDFARYSSFGLRAVLERAGFVVEKHHKSVGDARVLFQLAAGYLYKITYSRSARLNLLWAVILIAPVNLLGIVFGFLLPRNPDLYLDNIVLVRKRTEPAR